MKKFFSTFFTSSEKTASVTLGDFNMPANRNTEDILCIADIERTVGLEQIVDSPTHSSGSILNHVYISKSPNSFQVVDNRVIEDPSNPGKHHSIDCTLSFPPEQDCIWCNKASMWLPYKLDSKEANDHIKICKPCRLHRGLSFSSLSEVNHEPDSGTRSNPSNDEANTPNSSSSDFHLSGKRSTTQLNSTNPSSSSVQSQDVDKSRADTVGMQNTDSSQHSRVTKRRAN